MNLCDDVGIYGFPPEELPVENPGLRRVRGKKKNLDRILSEGELVEIRGRKHVYRLRVKVPKSWKELPSPDVREAKDAVIEAMHEVKPWSDKDHAIEDLPCYWFSKKGSAGVCISNGIYVLIDNKKLRPTPIPIAEPAYVAVNTMFKGRSDRIHEILVHELCHAADILLSHGKVDDSHGRGWQELMLAAGQEPSVVCKR